MIEAVGPLDEMAGFLFAPRSSSVAVTDFCSKNRP